MFLSKYVDVIAKDGFRLVRLQQVGRNAIVLAFQKYRICPAAGIWNKDEILAEEILSLKPRHHRIPAPARQPTTPTDRPHFPVCVDRPSSGLTSHSTLNRSYRRCSSQLISWLVLRKSNLKLGEKNPINIVNLG